METTTKMNLDSRILEMGLTKVNADGKEAYRGFKDAIDLVKFANVTKGRIKRVKIKAGADVYEKTVSYEGTSYNELFSVSNTDYRIYDDYSEVLEVFEAIMHMAFTNKDFELARLICYKLEQYAPFIEIAATEGNIVIMKGLEIEDISPKRISPTVHEYYRYDTVVILE